MKRSKQGDREKRKGEGEGDLHTGLLQSDN